MRQTFFFLQSGDMFGGARDQSATQVQQGSPSANQETWPYYFDERKMGKRDLIVGLRFCHDILLQLGNYGLNLRLVKSAIDMKSSLLYVQKQSSMNFQ